MNPIGYLGIFAGAVLEGEVVYISAIQAARAGYVDFYWAILTFFLGTCCTDWFYFLTGRSQGRRYLERTEKFQRQASRIDLLMAQRGTLLLLSYRFIYGFRIVLPLMFGVSKLPLRRFLFFSLLSTCIWMSVYGWLGYYFTSWLLSQLEKGNMVIGVFVFALILGFIIWIKAFKKQRK